tara:strand:- start:5595 stop:6452 length:858 start_codon:yes stop_codon:yes gene_type:complete
MEELLLLINPIIDFLTNNPEGVTLAYFNFGSSHPSGQFSMQGGTNQNYDPNNTAVAKGHKPSASQLTGQTGQSSGGMSGASGLIAEGSAMASAGWTDLISSMIGGKKRRAEQRAANVEHQRMRQEYMSLDVEDPYRNMINPYENMTVNQQQAEFQAQQSQQGLANMMGALQGAAGGSGVAGLAQVMANQQSRNIAQASASIGMQEQQIGMMAAQTEARRQETGAQLERQYKREQASTLYGIAQQRKAAADEAREAATRGAIGGAMQAVHGGGMIFGGIMGGGFGG